jgi:hypothetical protein
MKNPNTHFADTPIDVGEAERLTRCDFNRRSAFLLFGVGRLGMKGNQ